MRESTYWLSFLVLVISSLLVGCGGSSSKPKIDIAITPSTASIPFDSGVTLQATGSSLIQGTTVDWVVEQDPSCTIESPGGLEQPSGPCPSGWLGVPTPTGNLPATTANYSSPQTLGTYHVFAKERLQTGETGQAIATITVTLHKVDISIIPATATIPIDSSVDLQVTGSSLVKYTNVYWVVEEENLSCTTESLPPQAPSAPCPSGWVWEEVSIGFLPRIHATYYSPSTPGTYHVAAKAQLLTNETGQSVATITVTP